MQEDAIVASIMQSGLWTIPCEADNMCDMISQVKWLWKPDKRGWTRDSTISPLLNSGQGGDTNPSNSFLYGKTAQCSYVSSWALVHMVIMLGSLLQALLHPQDQKLCMNMNLCSAQENL